MANYKLSQLAEQDLRLISVATIEKWGRNQAKIYIQNLHEVMLKLAETPDMGNSRTELFDDARSFPTKQHCVYYHGSNQGIEVARILHQKMDSANVFSDRKI